MFLEVDTDERDDYIISMRNERSLGFPPSVMLGSWLRKALFCYFD